MEGKQPSLWRAVKTAALVLVVGYVAFTVLVQVVLLVAFAIYKP